MAQISVSNLTFCYEGSFDNIFENVSFMIDTDWKLGFIGRNGKGKTTFLNLLMGNQKEYQGHISTSTVFDYFPYQVTEQQKEQCCADFMEEWKTDCELWRIICELEKLHLEADVLYRPFRTLSHGERTKVMLAVLFSGENDFLLIDEPTNHLDQESREVVKAYLQQKKGFILVSHDRDLLDACIDHVLVLNRCTIEVQSGNFSSWWENKNRMDAFHEAENEKHKKEIRRLNKAAERTHEWADKSERTKIGFDPVKENDRSISARSYIGAKTKKMQSRRMQMEKRIADEIEQKEGLLQDIEHPVDLKLMPMRHHKEVLIATRDYGIAYCTPGNEFAEMKLQLDSSEMSVEKGRAGNENYTEIFQNFNFELRRGERVFLHGENGCGKSSLIKAILARCADDRRADKVSAMRESGTLTTASGLIVSYINQDTSYLHGSLKEYSRQNNLDESLFLAILRQLDLERVQFAKNMEDYSEGQKKKVLIAASLLKQAHLYIWDEPLNYIDIFSRMQIEDLILTYQPTMLVVEHDVRFREKIATRVVEM
ncbi:MAG: ABC-F family ATP-binding cassette domain-containing protein [Lachnospiraceae bacterium]|nr:ABC-F family ATP-binding cassette domain-containing protein [Lachnospiraceae bacterium]